MIEIRTQASLRLHWMKLMSCHACPSSLREAQSSIVPEFDQYDDAHWEDGDDWRDND